MEMKELLEFIESENRRLSTHYSFCIDKEKMILAKAAKLTEETGELCGEVLSSLKLQRSSKLSNHSPETLSDEFADVIITTLLLAKEMDVDIETALEQKISKIQKRNY